jgi:uncharacterized protein YjiS (DUF1127 family)
MAITVAPTDPRTVAFALRLYRHWTTEREQIWALWVLRANAMRPESV